MENNIIPKGYPICSIEPQSPVEYLFKVKFDKIYHINYGQFVQVSIPKVGEAPISISDFDEEEGTIDLLIRRVGTVTDGIFQLKVGDTLYLRGPYGNGFPYETYKDQNVIIIGGGSGVAPVRSIINRIYNHADEVQKLQVLFGFKNKELILFKEDIAKWRESMDLVVTLDEGQACEAYGIGKVTDHLDGLSLLKDEKHMRDLQVIIVGPPLMMKFTAMAIANYGVPDQNIWLSFERNMSCAVGKCGHCKINETYVCLDGPIFRYDTAKALID